MTDAVQPTSEPPQHGDRRALPRDSTLRPAEVAAPGASFAARVVDISPNGLQLRCTRPLATGQRVDVEVHPRPDAPEGRVYLVRGLVVRCVPHPEGYAVGLRLATHLGEAEDQRGPRLAAFADAENAVRDVRALLRQLGGDAASPLAYAAHRASEAPEAPPAATTRRGRQAAILALLLALLLLLAWRFAPQAQRTPPKDSNVWGMLARDTGALPPSLLVDTLLAAIEAHDRDAIDTVVDRLRTHRESTATQRLIGTLGEAAPNDTGVTARIVAALPGSAPEWQRLAETYLHTHASAGVEKAPPLEAFQTVAWFDDAVAPTAGGTQALPPAETQGSKASPVAPLPAAQPAAAGSSGAPEVQQPATPPAEEEAASQPPGMGGPLIPVLEGDPAPPESPNPDARPDPPATAPERTPAPGDSTSPPAGPVDAAPIRLEVDTGTFVLTVFRGEEALRRFPVGLGRNASTPTGSFRIANKLVNPAWYNRGNVVAAGDPANPIGAYWMGLGRDGKATSYGIHPTQDPDAIGAEMSRGCIRMRPADAAALFELVPLGTGVVIR